MGLILLTAPEEEPVTLDEAKLHLRESLSITTQDALIEGLIATSRERAEAFLRRALIEQEWRLTLDAFPDCAFIRLPLPPLISVESIKYVDLSGDLQTLSISNYVVDLGALPGKIDLAYGVTWPSTRREPNAVHIEFTCGYGDASEVPNSIKSAMKLDVASLFANREAELPMAARSLLWTHRFLEAA